MLRDLIGFFALVVGLFGLWMLANGVFVVAILCLVLAGMLVIIYNS